MPSSSHTPTAVILIVGLTRKLLDNVEAAPNLHAFANRSGYGVRTLVPPLPAVTCSAQATMLTGADPSAHGIVGNGWFNRQLGEVHFWKQSNRLIEAETVWETARKRDPSVTTLNMCWWFNMNANTEFSLTPRPIYRADGRKIPDCATHPMSLRQRVQERFGPFPLFKFWGPAAGIESSRWIAQAGAWLHQELSPGLTLIYLPHLDYAHQKHGPEAPESILALREIDEVAGTLISALEQRGTRIMLVSEYGIEPVTAAAGDGGGPVHINRVLREAGLLHVRDELGTDILDPMAPSCAAFAVADHQIAHIYTRNPADASAVAATLARTPGIEQVLRPEQLRQAGLAHRRSGDLVAIAASGRWFTYYHWLEDARAPDFARTVDIHRKPGYDPVELFLDPARPLIKATIARKLAMRKLGFRTLLDVIPLDAGLVRGTHGRVSVHADHAPVLVCEDRLIPSDKAVLKMQAVHEATLRSLFPG